MEASDEHWVRCACRQRRAIAERAFVVATCIPDISTKGVSERKRSPTVSPLDADGWCAVSALVLKKELSEIMDQLQEAGATDILAFDIANSRM